MSAHLSAQAALVRMLYDPRFAEAVRADPDRVLEHLPEGLRRELAAVDPRPLMRDRHRRERTLGQLCAELPCATALALVERGSMSVLTAFYESTSFHEAIESRQPLVLALAAYLEGLLAERTLRSPHLAAVLALELMSARARRGGEEPAEPMPGPRLRRARGVEVAEVAEGALATLQVVEAHRFRLSLLPGWALVNDSPQPTLPSLGPGRVALCAVCLRGAVSIVEIERPLHAILSSADRARTREALLAEAALRLGGDRSAAEAALTTLVEDELLVPTS